MHAGPLTALVLAAVTARADRGADIVVYGGTAGGVLAAVAAAREGKSVELLEPGRHLGGMVTGGLGATDTGTRAAVGGYSREFFDRVHRYYLDKYGQGSPQVKDCSGGFYFEPHVASAVLAAMLKEAKLTPRLGQRLAKVTKKGASIVSLTTVKGDTYRGKIFIDATYEGDLLAAAGVKSHVGREGRAVYGESLAGVQAFSQMHQFSVAVSGLADGKKLLPLIQDTTLGKPGDGDRKVQAYNYRLCLTDRKDNMVPFPKPAGYDPARYELLARYLKARPGMRVGHLMHPVWMPNRKTDTNNNGPISTDHIGASWDYPEADHDKRQKILADHVAYTQGLLYFLANDDRVPAALRQEMNGYGLAKDEYVDNGHWPTQLYVREARRMVGAYVMTQADLFTRRDKEDAVALGSYNTDSHHVQRVVKADGTVLNEGDFQVRVSPYAIPYRSLTPKAAECDNLLVPVCVSTSHVAYGTVRMEPVFLALGHACGVAASLAIDGKTTVQKVPIDKLHAVLKKHKAVLDVKSLPKGPARVAGLDIKKMAGVVVDDRDAKQTGAWQHSAANGPHVGAGYLHDGDADKGKMRVRFTPTLPRGGKYQVRLFYAPASNRATNVLVVVKSKDGEKEVRVNQRMVWNGDQGMLVGTYTFEAGQKGWVEVRNDGAKGHVVADAVQFLEVK